MRGDARALRGAGVRCEDPGRASNASPGDTSRNTSTAPALVFAATDDPAVNAAVVRDARSRGVLVNRADADGDEPGDFVTPARLQESAVTITVSAGSPALAALIRDGIRERWDERWSRMADAMRVLRPMILRQAELPEARRREVFRDARHE